MRSVRPASAARRLANVVVLATWLGATACGAGKSYSFDSVRIDATINADGSLTIREDRTFDFRGRFRFAFFTVEHRTFGDVVDFSVSEGGREYLPGAKGIPGRAFFEDPVLEGPGGFRFKATWWFEAEDERRTFTFRYRVLCAVDGYADAAHLLWRFVGEGWSVPTDRVAVTIHLPGRPVRRIARQTTPCTPSTAPPAPPVVETEPLRQGEVRAWGHGPLTGEVAIPDPQTVTLRVGDLAPTAFVEGSVLFPQDTVPHLYLSPQQGRSAVLAEEAALAREANAERARAREAVRLARPWRLLALAIVLGIPVLFLVLVVLGRLRDRVRGVPDHLHEPPDPDAHPAPLAVQWAWYHRRSGGSEAFRAQLLHLARADVLEIRPVGTVTSPEDHLLILRELPTGGIDERFCDFLFPKGDRVALKELAPSRKQYATLGHWWSDVQREAKQALPEMRGVGGRRETRFLGWLALSSILWSVPLALLADVAPVGYFGVVVTEAIAFAYLARRLLPRGVGARTRERMARWLAFARYLTRFSSLPGAPTAAVVIWEHYLVLAASLGVADRVEDQVRGLVPPERLPAPWSGVGSGVQALSSFHTFTRTTVPAPELASARASPPRASTSSTASSSSSSSSGSGGGFSSGGGRGGGGTGGGAG